MGVGLLCLIFGHRAGTNASAVARRLFGRARARYAREGVVMAQMFFRIIEIAFASYMVPALLLPAVWLAGLLLKRRGRAAPPGGRDREPVAPVVRFVSGVARTVSRGGRGCAAEPGRHGRRRGVLDGVCGHQ